MWEMDSSHRGIWQAGCKFQANQIASKELSPLPPERRAIPRWLQSTIKDMCDAPFKDAQQRVIRFDYPDQLVFTAYEAGQGMTPQIDKEYLFGPVTGIISLMSDVPMKFTHKHGKKPPITLLIEKRSLLVLSGESRFDWRHGIEEQEQYYVDNERTAYTRGNR